MKELFQTKHPILHFFPLWFAVKTGVVQTPSVHAYIYSVNYHVQESLTSGMLASKPKEDNVYGQSAFICIV